MGLFILIFIILPFCFFKEWKQSTFFFLSFFSLPLSLFNVSCFLSFLSLFSLSSLSLLSLFSLSRSLKGFLGYLKKSENLTDEEMRQNSTTPDDEPKEFFTLQRVSALYAKQILEFLGDKEW